MVHCFTSFTRPNHNRAAGPVLTIQMDPQTDNDGSEATEPTGLGACFDNDEVLPSCFDDDDEPAEEIDPLQADKGESPNLLTPQVTTEVVSHARPVHLLFFRQNAKHLQCSLINPGPRQVHATESVPRAPALQGTAGGAQVRSLKHTQTPVS